MAPVLSDALLKIGNSPALSVRRGVGVVWVPETPGGPEPAIGDEYGGGFFGGYISHTANGVATHRLIVAPRSTGATGWGYPVGTNYTYKTTSSNSPGAYSSFDGYANTQALIAGGIESHPAAQWCVSLEVGGFSDWYLPSRDELHILYDNLKPNLTANNTNHPNGTSYHVPARTAPRTQSDPAQTGVLAFRTGATQHWEAGTHWSSTRWTTTAANTINFNDGTQVNSGVTGTSHRTRAIRRVAIT